MLSHTLATELLKVATFLIQHPNVETNESKVSFRFTFWEKEPFVNAVQAFGSGKKNVGSYDFSYVPNGAPAITLSVARDKVCNKVQEEKWECQPLLTPEEFTRE